MAVPGFSVTELIQAASHFKIVYDGFFSKHSNSASLIRDLADHIQEFQTNLQAHKEVIESRGLEYSNPGYAVIKRTLDECEDFLNKYSAVLEKKVSVERLWRTGRFQYEQDTVARLQKRIDSHGISILQFNSNILMQDGLRRPQALDIPTHLSNTVVTPCPPPLLLESHRILESSQLSVSPGGASPQSPKWIPPPGSGSGQDSVQGSPLSGAFVSQARTDLESQKQNSDTVLQPPRDYCVAKICIGDKKNKTVTELRRKAQGRNTSKYCELLIFDENGEPRLSHQIKLGSRLSCYPYTWHSTWDRDLEVTFKGPSPESHIVKLYGRLAGPGIPSYVFTKHEDYMEFQSQVRGKELIDYYDFNKIGTSSQTEATDQHLKIWKNRITLDHSISFYASAAKSAIDQEFPISMLKHDVISKDDMTVRLDFVIVEESKGRLSKKPSRSSTGGSVGSSMSSSAPSVFSQPPMPRHQMTVTTVTDSRMSVISTGSETSQTQTDGSKSGLSPLETLAKKMKYIDIEFSDEDEADRFRRVYDKACKEETAHKEEEARKEEALRKWQYGTNSSQGPESVTSNMSPPGTPFTMSPVLRGQASPVLRPQR